MERSEDTAFQAKAEYFKRSKALVYMMTNSPGPRSDTGDGAMFYVDPFKLLSKPLNPAPGLLPDVEEVVATFKARQTLTLTLTLTPNPNPHPNPNPNPNPPNPNPNPDPNPNLQGARRVAQPPLRQQGGRVRCDVCQPALR